MECEGVLLCIGAEAVVTVVLFIVMIAVLMETIKKK